MYIVITSLSQAPEIVQPYFKTHCEWLHKYVEKDIFLASGPKKDHLGGAFLVRSIDRKQLDEIIAEDSYHQANVATYQIIDMDCKLAANGYEKLIGA